MNRLTLLAAPAALAAALVLGCQDSGGAGGAGHDAEHGAAHPTTAATRSAGGTDQAGTKVAVANIRPSQAASTQPSWGTPTGKITFTQTGGRVKITGDLTGLPPGRHGIHIHEKGDMSAPDLMSTGGHYNPDKHPHGGPTTSPVHAGDFGNLTADESGKASIDLTVTDITLGGEKNDVLGKPVIIHEKADDLKSQPSGNSGARIAGGLIEMQK
ncbi:MAG TPA: superoxide dismutase family protein [Tepidisphaeraceae bacterium]|nr:superoxide dismutase family protein [Tepidisphaeraceae bacterium]